MEMCAWLRSAAMNIAHLLRHTAMCFPDRPAITWRATTIDYRTFDERVSAFAGWLQSTSAAPSGRVVQYLDNHPDLLAAMFGTFRAGSAVLPTNSRLTDEELAFLIEDGDAAVVITDDAHAEVARRAAGSRARVVEVGSELDSLLATASALSGDVDVEADETAWIFYTSGTTGRPKGAMLPHGVLNFVTVSWLADLTPLTECDVTLHAAPLSHGAGFHAIAAVARGAHQVLLDAPSFDPPGVLGVIAEHGVTNTWMVPTQIVMLTDAAEQNGISGADLPSLQYVVYGGAPMTPASMTRALDRFGPIFVQLFGQGETPMTATVLRREDHVAELLGTAGRARPGIEVRIVDDAGADVAPGEVGELVVRGPSVMSGYWNRPEATAEAIRDGWLHTGDLGTMSVDGIIRLLDRAKDMIISGGSNVYAVEVESVLATHAAVAEVAVIGIPDDLWGELVVAVVVPAGADEGADVAALDSHARAHLAGYKIPRRYIVADELPRNAYGKVVKRDLRAAVADGTLS
jgi:acyl-CoA synthetase (AMP-forming)/AMP-acid ligase II